jgi:hypothetical protein
MVYKTFGDNIMLEINKNYVLDTNQKPIAVQIPIAEFEKIEEILEDYGLRKLIEEVENDETLSKVEALKYLASIKNNNVEN